MKEGIFMKKLVTMFIMTVLACFCFVSIACAARVAVVLDTPLFFSNDKKNQALIDKKMLELFPQPKFELVTTKECVMKTQIWREEHGLASVVSSGGKGEVSYEWALKQDEIADLTKKLNSDYAFVLRATGNAKDTYGMMGEVKKSTVVIDARVFNVAKNEYTYMEQFVYEGTSKKGYIPFVPTFMVGGTPNYKRAFVNAMKKGLEDIKIDTNTI